MTSRSYQPPRASSPLQWQKTAPTRDQADAFLAEQIERRLAATDANDMLYAFDSSPAPFCHAFRKKVRKALWEAYVVELPFWQLETERATAVETEAGTWQVRLDVQARKKVYDSAGSQAGPRRHRTVPPARLGGAR